MWIGRAADTIGLLRASEVGHYRLGNPVEKPLDAGGLLLHDPVGPCVWDVEVGPAAAAANQDRGRDERDCEQGHLPRGDRRPADLRFGPDFRKPSTSGPNGHPAFAKVHERGVEFALQL
jgi:hypothetical protein